ncbi:MAG TPA: sigma-70 family RNA polymerase sigma factor [Terriglobales bacterium]|nr:sigma-70 family RNA polymerase sigma factor [Terriglobales bacterium]
MSADLVMAEKAIAMTQAEENPLEVAVRGHARMVYRIAYSVLRDVAEAEDVTQEVFLRALRRQNVLSNIRDQKAWLARIAWRVAVERNRNAKPNAGEVDDLRAEECSAEEALWQKQRSSLLQQLIAALPDELRHPLVLSALEELSPREIAATLDISEAAVRSRCFRARQILRQRLTAWTEGRKQK